MCSCETTRNACFHARPKFFAIALKGGRICRAIDPAGGTELGGHQLLRVSPRRDSRRNVAALIMLITRQWSETRCNRRAVQSRATHAQRSQGRWCLIAALRSQALRRCQCADQFHKAWQKSADLIVI